MTNKALPLSAMIPLSQPTVVGLELGESTTRAARWDGARLSTSTVDHENTIDGTMGAGARAVAALQPRRPFNLVIAASRADLCRRDLESYVSLERSAGAISVRLVTGDGRQAEVEAFDEERVEPAGRFTGRVGAIEWARLRGHSRCVILEKESEIVTRVRSRLLARRPADGAWMLAPFDAAVETWQQGDPPGEASAVEPADSVMVAVGRHAGDVRADREVLVPEEAEAFRSVGLLFIDPMIDFAQAVPTGTAERDERSLRRHYAALMEQAARAVRDAGYEPDDATLYRLARIKAEQSEVAILSMESFDAFDRLGVRLRDQPDASLRLVLRAIIATSKPSLAVRHA